MHPVSLTDAPAHDPDRFVAAEILAGEACNVRIIRLAPGQSLPAHTHEPSELVLYAVEGTATLDTDTAGTVSFGAGTLAHYPGGEELRVTNAGDEPVTLLAYLTPPFPPRT